MFTVYLGWDLGIPCRDIPGPSLMLKIQLVKKNGLNWNISRLLNMDKLKCFP
jgi:hypothetical protein